MDTYFTNNAQKGRLYISTNAATIKGLVGNIKTVTSSLGFDPAFADNLADFADPSTDVPTNPNQMGGGKLVPMLYQIAVTNGLRQVTLAGKKAWEFETRVMYETWFPYSVTANKQYSVKLPSVPKVVINSTAPVLPATFPWAMVSNGWQTTATTITTLPPTILTPTNTFFTNAYVVVWRTLYTNALTLVNSTLTQPQSATVVNGIG
ncbi:MAG: hypothetical protein NTY53_14380, partial [Kiritimatiellaeota bacterium]|nr:hypothetical protein [Kiritimatiellota bacterium]